MIDFGNRGVSIEAAESGGLEPAVREGPAWAR
jgi:hypothetical protein